MDREKRKGGTSIPENLEDFLNEVQRQALPGIKCLGWEPRFLRKTMFQAPELVMRNSSDGRTAILDVDGRIRIQNIKMREQEGQKTSEMYCSRPGGRVRIGNLGLTKEVQPIEPDPID